LHVGGRVVFVLDLLRLGLKVRIVGREDADVIYSIKDVRILMSEDELPAALPLRHRHPTRNQLAQRPQRPGFSITDTEASRPTAVVLARGCASSMGCR